MPGFSRREILLGGAGALTAFAAGGLGARQALAAEHSLTLSRLNHSVLPETVTADMMSFSPVVRHRCCGSARGRPPRST